MPESLFTFLNVFSNHEIKMNGHYKKIKFLVESVCLTSVENPCEIVLCI